LPKTPARGKENTLIYHDHDTRIVSDPYSFADLEAAVRDTARALREHAGEFDTIAVTGLSGVVVGAPVALRLRKKLAVLRKPDEKAHGRPDAFVGDLGKAVLFLDDFAATGNTLTRMRARLEEEGRDLVGAFMYRDQVYARSGSRVPSYGSLYDAVVV
jgi:orotate phosphoribosyltransferase